MAEPTINHVSLNVANLGEAVSFYTRLLGARPLATPDFGIPVQWLDLGGTQLHLVQREPDVARSNHFGVTIDDLSAAFEFARDQRALDSATVGHYLVHLYGDIVQLYVRDPSGNHVELDCSGVERITPDLRSVLKTLRDLDAPGLRDDHAGRGPSTTLPA